MSHHSRYPALQPPADSAQAPARRSRPAEPAPLHSRGRSARTPRRAAAAAGRRRRRDGARAFPRRRRARVLRPRFLLRARAVARRERRA